MAIVGLGGTGRGEMAPFSDLDLMFLTSAKPTPRQTAVVEAMLHLLWDLKLKVGHSVRSIGDLMTLARSDMTVRTAFLEARLIWGEQVIFDQAMQRFRSKIVSGTAAEFVDPADAGAIAAALERVVTDKARADELRGLGLEQSKLFDWKRTAEATLSFYRRILGA